MFVEIMDLYTVKHSCTVLSGLVGIIGLLIFQVICDQDCSDRVTVVSIQRQVPASMLSCWTCRHSRDSTNANCIDMHNRTAIEQIQCPLHQSFCRIHRLLDDINVELIERSCTDTCTPDCKKINRLDSCESCCTQPLCNHGNAAPTSARAHTGLLFAAFVIDCGRRIFHSI